MNKKILDQIDGLAEFLVLWDGKNAAGILEKLQSLERSADGNGMDGIADAIRKGRHALADGEGEVNASALSFLEELVSALQDVFSNGRDPMEVKIFRPEPRPGTKSAAASGADRKILADFLARQDGVMEDFECLILDWEKHKTPDSMSEILRLMHTVKGESALLELSEVEKICHAVEGYLERVSRGAKVDLLLEAKDWFLQVFRFHSGRGESPIPADPLWERLMMKEEAEESATPESAAEEALPPGWITLSAWIEIPPSADRDILSDFVMESREHLESADLKIMSMETDPHNQDSMNAVFRAFHSIKGIAVFLGLEGIGVLSHEVETLLDMVRSGKLRTSESLVDLFLESVDAMRKLISALQSAPDRAPRQDQADGWNGLLARVRGAIAGKPPQKALNLFPFKSSPELRHGEILVQSGAVSSNAMVAALTSQMETDPPDRLGELLVKDGVASAQQVAQALRCQKAAGIEAVAADRSVLSVKETVKVEAERLDRLLDAIGELVIAESMIVQSPEFKGKVSPMMAQRLVHLDKITRGLQEMGTSLRMVPIRPVFQKMARLVRDLGKKQGKAIEFNTNGDETELDKTVVEKIGDPLVHMVRNAIDHGIEADSADRIAVGKPGTATVRLSAFQKGGNICIKLEDDGRGLNREAILAKARERGLIKTDAVLEDREVWLLIFEPGFSTAQAVTETSGRGVGMDVVKRNVEELRGRIEIQSLAGKGTSFSIWLPLTLAIIDGMIVRLGKERFIFPTLSILRIVPLIKEEILTVVGKGEMLKLQDELVPLLRLNQLYPGFDSSGWSRLAVIVESDGKRIGVPVDELLGQQQIVIKALGESFKSIVGLTGGAILSDGNVGMILDVDGLMKGLQAEEARV